MSPDPMALIGAIQVVLRGRKGVPQSCGYYIGWCSVTACSPYCNGGYCDHYQEDENYYSEQEDGMS